MLIPAFYLVLIYSIAAFIKASQRQWEHTITRAAIAVFFAFVTMDPSLDIFIARILSRYLVFLLALVEVFSWIAINYQKNRIKNKSAK